MKKFVLALVSCVVIAYGCKPVDKGSQAKVDDSDARKTEQQKQWEKEGKPGTKLFNITKLIDEDTDDGSLIIIPIAISLEIKNKNILEKAINFLDFLSGYPSTDTKIAVKIKDLRHAHSKEPTQKITFDYRTVHKQFKGRNKHGTYSINFRKPPESFPTMIGSLFFYSKKTGGSYAAVLAKEVTSSYELTGDERVWMLGNIVAYYSEGHVDYNRYVEYQYVRSDDFEQYRLKWDDGRFTIINKSSKLGQPSRWKGEIVDLENEQNYISDKDLVNSRIHEIYEEMKEGIDL